MYCNLQNARGAGCTVLYRMQEGLLQNARGAVLYCILQNARGAVLFFTECKRGCTVLYRMQEGLYCTLQNARGAVLYFTECKRGRIRKLFIINQTTCVRWWIWWNLCSKLYSTICHWSEYVKGTVPKDCKQWKLNMGRLMLKISQLPLESF